MEIADRRIREGMQTFDEAIASRRLPVPTFELEFDTEVFYTVAADFLKLAALIIGDPAFLPPIRFTNACNPFVTTSSDTPMKSPTVLPAPDGAWAVLAGRCSRRAAGAGL
jgi:hypothetical protein